MNFEIELNLTFFIKIPIKLLFLQIPKYFKTKDNNIITIQVGFEDLINHKIEQEKCATYDLEPKISRDA